MFCGGGGGQHTPTQEQFEAPQTTLQVIFWSGLGGGQDQLSTWQLYIVSLCGNCLDSQVEVWGSRPGGCIGSGLHCICAGVHTLL